uniref:site-specific DNA-methyltransferase n=1 Tax=Eubacterium cellulosolvens TaxID=29322 RepID=UPI000484C13A|nr:site-specific DNA-methyltransferase [[Eubacterium] cellulosolvens]
MENGEQLTFEFEQRPTIKGFPELRWTGKRPYRSTQYYPAQLRELYGEEQNGWINKIFWGDNLQVMSHLLRDYRGNVDLIYIDPPFDSKANYKLRIKVKKQNITSDSLAFEEKQYGDIWSNDEYLQYMYERLLIMRELLSDHGSIFVHCDYHKNYHIRALLDEVFGPDNFKNEIIWRRKGGSALGSMNSLSNATDTIFWYSKTPIYTLNPIYAEAPKEYVDTQFRYSDPDGRRYMITVMRSPNPRPNLMYDYKGYKMPPNGWAITLDKMKELDAQGYLHFPDSKDKQIYKKIYLDEYRGQAINNLWTEISTLKGNNSEITNYPTQKPEELLARIIEMASNPGDLVFDCFMGSGTTQAVAMKLGRRFIGADINLGAIQTTTKRLLAVAADLNKKQLTLLPDGEDDSLKYTSFEVYNVNNYDFFRNPVEARDLLIAALEIQPFPQSDVWDGELDGRMVKIMPVNRIATKADLKELLANLPYKTYEKRKEENPNQPVERITIVCMGHEPDLKGALEQELTDYKVDIQIMDILRDKADIQLKRDSEAEIVHEGDKLVIRAFYPMNLMQKLSLQKEYVEDWRQLVDSIMIDWNYDGVVMQPTVTDVPGKNEMVKGIYDIPVNFGTIKVKITDLLSESLEVEVR